MEIIWTQKAIDTNEQNIEYLILNWDKNVLVNYIDKVEEAINKIALNPHLGSFEPKLGYNKILVVKQIYLLYKVDNESIYLMLFWNNYKKPIW